MLSPAFIRSPDGQYGTRCSTLVITERVNKRLVTHVLERTFTAAPGLALLRRASLKDWPPRYLLDDPQAAHGPADPPSEISPVADAELAEAPSPGAAVPAKKRRVRSLLKPVATPLRPAPCGAGEAPAARRRAVHTGRLSWAPRRRRMVWWSMPASTKTGPTGSKPARR